MMKRRISAVLLVAMLLSIFAGIPLGNKAYAEDVLKQYGDLYYTIENGEASIVGCDLEATGEIEVPSTIEGCPVVRIKEDSNYYKKGMAFSCCEKITKISIPKECTEFSASCFGNCFGLESIEVDKDNPTFCSENGIVYTKDKKKLVIAPNKSVGTGFAVPDGVETIGDYAFYWNTVLEKISLNDVNTLDCDAFACCENLKTVTECEKLKKIDEFALSACSLEQIDLPERLVYIGEGAFSFTRNLRKITLPDSLTYMGTQVFRSSALERIKMPSNITEIPGSTCSDCKNLETVELSPATTVIGYSAFAGCTSLESITLPEKVETIGEGTFHSCSKLKEITLPKGLKNIEALAFYGCQALEEIILPETLENLGGYSVFTDCTSLKNIYFKGDCPQTGDSSIFDGLEATAYYPEANETWTEEKRQNYGGTITWKTWNPSNYKEIDGYSYSFSNSHEAFGYARDYTIPLSSYQLIYGNNVRAEDIYQRKTFSDIPNQIKRAWEGNCAGMTATSEMLADSTNGINPANFNADAADPKDLKVKDRNAELEIDLTAFIEAMHVAQYTQIFKSDRSSTRVVTSDIRAGRNDLNAFHDAIKAETDAGRPVLLAMMPGDGTGHAILGYAVEDHDDGTSSILIYDNRWPLQELSLTLAKDSSGKYTSWSYNMDANGVAKYGVWGTDQSASNISFVYYDTLMEIWNTRGHLDESGSTNMLTINSDDFSLYSSSGQELARVEKGELVKTSNDIDLMERELSLREDNEPDNVIVAPIAVYRVVNNDKSVEQLEVSAANAELGASVNTTASEVVVAVQDSVNYNSVTVCADPEDTYTVSLKSTLNDDYNEIIATGVGTEEDASISMVGGVLDVEDCALSALVIDGEDQGPFTIKASAGDDGTISPDGESKIEKGKGLTYTITPNAGYAIKDILVDGKSVGAVSTYEFKDVKGAHSIVAQFERTNLYGDTNGDNNVDASDLTRLAKHLAKIETITSLEQLENADVNHDGKVSSEDLTKLARYVAKIITDLD